MGASSQCQWLRSAAPSALFLWNILIPGAASLQPALARFSWSSSLHFRFISLGSLPSGPRVIRMSSLGGLGSSQENPCRLLLHQQRDPQPCRKGRNQILCQVLSHILKNGRQGNSMGRFKFAPLWDEASPVPIFLFLGNSASLLMWLQILQPFVKAQGFKIFLGFNLLVFTCV